MTMMGNNPSIRPYFFGGGGIRRYQPHTVHLKKGLEVEGYVNFPHLLEVLKISAAHPKNGSNMEKFCIMTLMKNQQTN